MIIIPKIKHRSKDKRCRTPKKARDTERLYEREDIVQRIEEKLSTGRLDLPVHKLPPKGNLKPHTRKTRY